MSLPKRVQAVIDFCDDNHVDIISYGLAPNPNGFCYEADDDVETKELEEMLDALTSKEENELRKYIFG